MLGKEALINIDNSEKQLNHLNFVILKKNLHVAKFFFTIYLMAIFFTAQSFYTN